MNKLTTHVPQRPQGSASAQPTHARALTPPEPGRARFAPPGRVTACPNQRRADPVPSANRPAEEEHRARRPDDPGMLPMISAREPLPVEESLEDLLPRPVPVVRGPIAVATPVATPQPVPAKPGVPARASAARFDALKVAGVMVAMLGLAGMVATVTVVAAISLGSGHYEAPIPVVYSAPVVDVGLEDTGFAEVVPPPVVRPTGPARSPAVVVAAPPPKPTGPGSVTVRVPSEVFVSEAEVRCQGGFADRAPFVDTVAVVPGVPMGDSCSLRLLGGAAWAQVPVDPHSEILCDFPTRANANCH